MNQSLFNGVNGIKAQNVGVDVTASNIANVNTIGYKRTSSEFADIFYKRVASQSTNPTESGGGSLFSASKVVYEQGSFTTGDGEFDVALNGRGFFGVRGGGTTYYTRNGEWSRDGDGYLVDANGNYVLGTMNPNFTATTYSQRVAQAMGLAQNVDGTYVTDGFIVNNPSEDFDLSRSTGQSILQVPVNMYYYPETTTQATFSGTLNVQALSRNILNSVQMTDANNQATNFASFTPDYTSLNLSGTIDANLGANVGDTITIELVDANGTTFQATTTLGANSTFSLTNFTPTGTTTTFDMASASVQSAKVSINGVDTDITTDNAALQNLLTKNATTANLKSTAAANTWLDSDGNAIDARDGDTIIVTLRDKNNRVLTQEVTLDSTLSFDIALNSDSGLDVASASITAMTLSGDREYYEDKAFSVQVYNTDGSIGTLRYTLHPQGSHSAGQDYVYDVVAGIYDSSGNLVGSESRGEIRFNQYGALIANNLTSIANPMSGNTIAINFGTATATPSTNGIGPGWDGVKLDVSGNSSNDLIDSSANGAAEGFFSRYDIQRDGSIVATFSNGKTATVAKLALYNFINEQGLAQQGANNFIATANSGEASFLYDEQGNFIYTATFVGNQLEASNTDLSTELTNLIVMQRAFEASSKSITTRDDMIQTAIGLRE